MRTLKELLIVLCFLSLIEIITSCEKKAGSDNMFLISVDSVKLPEGIIVNTSFDILCYGTVGTDGCNSFSRFETEKLNNIITVETWGEFHESSSACPDVMVYLEGEKLNFKLEETGSYLLRMKRKDGTYLERQIIVE